MKLVIGNQKTYLNRPEVIDFINKTRDSKCENAIICASFPYLDLYLEDSKYMVGAQNVSVKGNGASTGEISAEQLSSLGVTYTIVGHSERRSDNNETSDMFVSKIKDELENRKVDKFIFNKSYFKQLSYFENLINKELFFQRIFLEQREANIEKDVVGKQIMEVFDNLDSSIIEKIIVAYEPVWAIGTGKVPTNEEIDDIICYIKDLIQDKYGARLLVLYGGSVNAKNIDELNLVESVDGYLIGGASTKPEEFIYIMNKCE